MEKELLLKMYRELYLSRIFEERLVEMYMDGEFTGMLHPSIGQEACGVGAVNAFEEEDFIGLHHRNHPHMVARGCDMGRLIAEVLSKETGFCMGKAGDVHIMDKERNIVSVCGTLGAGFNIAMGPAFVFKTEKKPYISVVFSGDSSTSEGQFHEAMNMSKAYNLPLLFVVENNLFGMSTRLGNVTGGIEKISIRARGYDMPAICVEAYDVETVYDAAKTCADYVRSGNGPMMLELLTWRFKGHSVGDSDSYKNPQEQAYWVERDPIKVAAQKLIDKYKMTEQELKKVDDACNEQLKAWEKFAKESPDSKPEVAFMHMEA